MKGHLNYLAVLAAAISSFAVGGMWYRIFAAPWKRANNFDGEPPAGNPVRDSKINVLRVKGILRNV
jgi:hypothetical protein